MKKADGKCYEGEWQKGEMHGHGVYRWPNGSVLYEGQWVDGRGIGKYTCVA